MEEGGGEKETKGLFEGGGKRERRRGGKEKGETYVANHKLFQKAGMSSSEMDLWRGVKRERKEGKKERRKKRRKKKKTKNKKQTHKN